MKLYFDIGNTDIKLNYNLHDKEHYVSYPTNSNHTVDSFYFSLPDEVKSHEIESVWIVSVVPNTTSILDGMVKKYFGIKSKIFGQPLKTGVKLNVDNPKEVGEDIVALATLIKTKNNNSIMVNIGTATTIIHVVNNELKGVVICSGLMTQLNSLIKNASKLNDIELKVSKNSVGKNSQEAISIGILHGHAEMIKGLINKIDNDAKVFISGGLAKRVNRLLDYEYIKEATLEGLKEIEKININ